jgi:hypothetical protein
MNPPSGVYRQWMSGPWVSGVVEQPARGCMGGASGAPDASGAPGAPDASGAPDEAARPPDRFADAVRFASILRAAQALSDRLGELCDRL